MFTEKLIILVKERQFLYYSSHSDYKNRPVIRKAWREISREIGIEHGYYWARKWRHLRLGYIKFKKKRNPNKKWKWAEQMKFLDDYLKIDVKKCVDEEDKNESITTAKISVSNDKGDTEKVVQNLRYKNLQNTRSSDIGHVFQTYAESMKRMPVRMQRSIKFKMASMFASYQAKNPRRYAVVAPLPLKPAVTGVIRKSYNEVVFEKSMQKTDLIKFANYTSIGLLTVTLLKQLFLTCEQLYTKNFFDNSNARAEFTTLRNEYKRELYGLVTVANAWEIPINLPSTWSMVHSGLEWSRYHREFEELLFIAKGGCGTVCKARHILDGVEYAVKKIVIKSHDLDAIMCVLSEVKTAANMDHPNVVNYKTAWLEPLIESNIKKNPSAKIDTDSVNIGSSTISSIESNLRKSFETHNSKESNKSRNSSLIISFEKSSNISLNSRRGCHSMSIEESDGASTSAGEKESLLNANYKEGSRVNLKWATLYIQMTYCSQTLKQWLDNRNPQSLNMMVPRNVSEILTDFSCPIGWTYLEVVTDMFTQMVKGLHYIHSRGVIHHDITPSNVFVTKSDGGCKVQLGDFGLACSSHKSHSNYACGTPLYAAPEQLNGKCNPKSDLYSLGIILLEMVEFFSTAMECVKNITDLKRGHISAHLSDNYPKIADIIIKLTHRLPDKRPNSFQLLEELRNTAEDKNETIELLRQELAAKDEEITELKMMPSKLKP